jgi:hypothetical protein
MTDARRVHDLMISEGFSLHRTGKHLIWRDAAGVQVVTATTASDRRHLANVKRDIRRARHRSA